MSNSAVLAYWRLVPLSQELQIRRISWLQELAPFPDVHEQVITVLCEDLHCEKVLITSKPLRTSMALLSLMPIPGLANSTWTFATWRRSTLNSLRSGTEISGISLWTLVLLTSLLDPHILEASHWTVNIYPPLVCTNLSLLL